MAMVLEKRLKDIVILSAIIVIIGFFALDFALPSQEWIDIPLHSFLETLGLAFGLFAAVLLLSPDHENPEFLSISGWVAAALVGMVIFDGFHAAVAPGHAAVWFHNLAVLIGGVMFSGIWWGRYVRKKLSASIIVGAVALFAIALGTASTALPWIIPFNDLNNTFTLAADGIIFAGGMLFIIAAAYILSRAAHAKAREFLPLSVFCTLNGIAGMLSPITTTWIAAWWFWHLLRVAAYFILFYGIFTLFVAGDARRDHFLLEEAMDQGKMAYWELDVPTLTFSFNDRFYALYGTSAEREGGYRMPAEVYSTKFVHPDEAGLVAKEIETALKSTDPNYFAELEHRIIRGDGEVRHIVVRYRITKNIEGKTVKTHGVNQDITARKRAEEALRENHFLLEEAMDQGQMAYWELDVPTLTFTFNDRFYALYGTTAEREGGYRMPAEVYATKFVFPEESDMVASEIEKSLSTTDPHYFSELEHRIIRGDGEVRHIVVRYRVTKNAEGKTIKTHGVNQDITARKHSEEALREGERRYRDFIEFLPQTAYELDSAGQIISFNRAAVRLFGYSEKELSRMTAFDILDPISQEHARNNIIRIMKGEKLDAFEYTARRKDGSTFPLLVYSAPRISGQKIVGTRGLAIDISSRKHLEEDLLKSLTEKDTLIKEVHHRVKNNLQIIASFLNLQLRKTTDSSAVEALKDSQSRVRTMGLVHEHLYQSKDLSHIELGKYLHALEMMHFSTHDGRKQHITFDLNVPEIYVDPTIAIPLGLAINELISNSIKHAFPEKREGKISIRGEESNGLITLLVQDDGIGIPADVDWKNTQSLGLGLVIGLIDQIDGKIEKGPGPGTTFIITIDSKYTVSI